MIGEQPIGGFRELRALDASGELAELLAACVAGPHNRVRHAIACLTPMCSAQKRWQRGQ